MSDPFSRIDFPELFLGFVAPIGTDLQAATGFFSSYFAAANYQVVEVKVTDVFRKLALHIKPADALKSSPEEARLQTYIKYGNQIRKHFSDDQILAALTIVRVIQARASTAGAQPEKTVYLLKQFKRREEIELFRSVYGRAFFQISVYSRRGARVENLAQRFARGDQKADTNLYRDKAEKIVQTDADEIGDAHGQQVSRIFHDADVIINSDFGPKKIEDQVNRFCNLLFSSNKISPTREEYGMFAAKAAALRTLDLSRQVGAAIFSSQGEVISMGSNEVPKAGGGTYWAEETVDAPDDRDFRRGYDSNDQRKNELLTELFNLAKIPNKDELLKKPEILNSQFMDALEYGRIIHAEMSAICDAARLGRSVKGATLFTTTFPCHMCAKHIVAAGIDKVIFLEPYPKSLTGHLHADSVKIEGADRGLFAEYPSVEFCHFHGISPRRYRELFERPKRKDADGNFEDWKGGKKQPLVDLKFPFYMNLEGQVLKATQTYLDTLKLTVDALK